MFVHNKQTSVNHQIIPSKNSIVISKGYIEVKVAQTVARLTITRVVGGSRPRPDARA